MYIQRISVTGFRVLTELELADLSPGLTVLHGANGSGKTTLLHFLQAMFCGSVQADQLSVRSGETSLRPGGALGLKLPETKVELIRHFRSGRADRVAISLTEGDTSTLTQMHRRIQQVNRERLTTVFAPMERAHDLLQLVETALRDGVELRTEGRQEGWLSDRIERVRRERSELFEGNAPMGRVADLEHRRLELHRQLQELSSRALILERDGEDAELDGEELGQIRCRIDSLHAELGAAQSDLSEFRDRIWAKEPRTRRARRKSTDPNIHQKIAALIVGMTRFRAVLCDLASSRCEISMRMSQLAGSPRFNEPSSSCGNGNSPQERARRRQTEELARLKVQREEIDRCEAELMCQIERMRQRHEELLSLRPEDGGPPIEAADPHEARQRQAELLDRVQDLREKWWAVLATERDLMAKRRSMRLQQTQQVQQRLREVRRQFAAVEQELADAREQWQSLTLLQQILQRTDEKLRAPRPSSVMVEASQLLQRTTCGRYCEFRFHEESGGLTVITGNGKEVPLADLSRGTLDQAALSFRLALCTEYARRGESFPLILDDVLADSDEERLRHSVAVLNEYAQKPQQILFFTCQDHLADMFETMGVSVRSLGARTPVSISARSRVSTISTPGSGSTELDSPDQSAVHENKADRRTGRRAGLCRVQPASPYWLELNSPLSLIPSMSSQMARRLGALGVRDVGDLIDLDPFTTEVPLDGVQVPIALLRAWQAEGRLLALVPNLTGRDAQLIVSAGCHSPTQLADTEAEDLWQRVECARQERAGEPEIPWLADFTPRPDAATVQHWIAAAHLSRSYEQARQTANRRRPDGLTERRRLRRQRRRQQREAGTNGRTRHAG